MLLKTLSLAGFKSFADRTRLVFDSGVNVVVGPNGSGKSNLLDALAWAMGTQATSTLRTQRMEDVIFAGTATRPALGRAEVSITFDNGEGFLPIELAEITVTRRLLRDGTSEYELNGAQCRLLDIQELLSDGGIGRQQHVLVGQGQIGDILSARPDEQRLVIEEAAGITKHRNRRDRAVRRLDQTDIDVERLTDILEQERRRLRPLRRQANAAERHEAIKTRVWELHLWIGGQQLRSIRTRLVDGRGERARLEGQITAGAGDLEVVEARVNRLESRSGAAGRALQRDSAAAARLETLVERFRRIMVLSRERRLAMESRLQGAVERRSDLEGECADLERALEDIAVEELDARARAEERETALQALEDEERALNEQVQLPAEGLLANLRGDLRSLEAAEERDTREAEQVAARRGVVVQRLADENESIVGLLDEIRSADGEVTASQVDYREARERREIVQQSWEETESVHRAAHLKLVETEARHDAIAAALAGLVDPAARERAEAASGVSGSVVGKLDVPADLAVAVDAALGTWSDALATVDRQRTEEVVGGLKSDGLGGVALFTSDGPTAALPAAEVAAAWGLEALVDRLGAGADTDLAAALLGDVILVEGWASGWQLVARHRDVRAVTPEGDLITFRGIHLGSADGAGPAALEAAGVAVERAQRDLARAASHLTSTRRSFEQARDVERVALEKLEMVEARLAGHTEALALNERTRTASEAELARLDARSGALAAARSNRVERIGELRERIDDLDGDGQERTRAWEAIDRRRAEVARRRDEARRLREEAMAVVAGIEERKRLTLQRLDAATSELGGFEDRPVDPHVVARLEQVEGTARLAAARLGEHIEALRTRQHDLRAHAGKADQQLEAAYQERRDLQTAVEGAKERIAALNIELAELTVREETVGERLRRDADADEETALAAQRPELDEDADPAEELADLEARLRRMGPINPLAAEEYRLLSERVDELEAQLADLETSRSELRKVIRALDEEMTVMFLAAFEEIAALYEENFAMVFPGGTGLLRLTDARTPLSSGVEIEAQPLGKKVGRLSLLSGGERSLAALAFLFAVFRARPSPFYVLDEVEAALDDVNLRRFLRLVDTLRGAAQLVIITHQPQTMEAADVLYGVTMEPGESSQVVAKRLQDTPV